MFEAGTVHLQGLSKVFYYIRVNRKKSLHLHFNDVNPFKHNEIYIHLLSVLKYALLGIYNVENVYY